MIRIAHFSDLHYGPRNLAEADRCFSAAIDRAIALGAEAAVISGDATDHGLDLHAPAVGRLAVQLRRLADHCPVLMLQGTFSHEPPGTLSIFRLLGGRHPIHVAERIEQVVLTARSEWIPSNGWCFDALPPDARAVFTFLPTVNRAVVAATVGAAEAAQAVGEHLAQLLRGYAPIHRTARRLGIPTVGVSHGTVFGSLNEHGVPMAGFDHEFTTGALFGSEAQAFMLGHIHRHQSWELEGRGGRQCIAYAGSIGRFHYGEEGEKGFLCWDVDADQAQCTLEPTPARRTMDIVFEGKPDLDALRASLARQDIAGAYLRVRWTVADEDRHGVDRAAIEQLLTGAAEIKLEGRIVPVVRARAAGISQLANLADKVQAWAEVAGISKVPLQRCLVALRTESPEDIAQNLLRAGTSVAL
ncbi:metallophosphatase family protein [Dechloromonas sp. CZR5]|uniref:metallophosphoesterase family protein n=1 Tax=Dechloromonas sp. CZR5 TaxID=2608630 RepID=UPI00123D7388|nr:metallophosphatase family protein [Dechloromonas sp. CZR5]